MKRLAHPDINYVIEFEENKINSIIIENKDFFRKTISELFCQIDGADGQFVLSEDYSAIDISKNAELLTQFIPFEMNKKTLTSKICTAVEKKAINETNYTSTQELLSIIECYLDKLLFDFSYNFEYEKLNIGNLIKSVGITITEDYDNGLEKILDYMQLVREFDKEKLFIFVNLRSYHSDKDFETFTREVRMRKFLVLFIDNMENSHFEYEKRLIIDKDLCEIYSPS